MSVNIPNRFEIDLGGSVGGVGPITIGTLPAIPNIPISVDKIPKLLLGIDPLTINPVTINPLTLNPLTLNPLTLNPLTLNPLTVTLNPLTVTLTPITLNPIALNLAIKEIPNVRVHLPADFCVGFSVLGFELFTLRLCGEAQAITEPYQPNPCEICIPMTSTQDPMRSS